MRHDLILVSFALATAMPSPATNCPELRPCATLGPKVVFFVGEVLSKGSVMKRSRFLGERLEYKLRVIEPLFQMPVNSGELVVWHGNYWKPGDRVLVNAGRGEDGALETGICTFSGPVDLPYLAPLLSFLRGLRNAPQEASLHVRLLPSIDGALVTADGPVRREALTQKGIAQFTTLPPGTYRVVVSAPGYAEIEKQGSLRELTLVPQSCPTSSKWLEPQLEVSGIVKDTAGHPVPGVALQLWEHAPIHLLKVFAASSSHDGRFRFTNVKPGTFDLVTADYRRTSYFPGRATKAESTPIELNALAPQENLVFMLFDSGPARKIRIRVMDQSGAPVPDVSVRDMPFSEQGLQVNSFSLTGGKLKTGPDGTVSFDGVEGGHYRVDAIHGVYPSDFLISKPAEIPPGKGAVLIDLKLAPVRRYSPPPKSQP